MRRDWLAVLGMVLWLCGAPFALAGAVRYAESLVDTSALDVDAFDVMDWKTVAIGFVVLMVVWAVTLTLITRLAEHGLQRRPSERFDPAR